VGSNNTLVSMDLLKPFAAGVVPDVSIADGVVEMRALYGVSNSPPYASLDNWVDPTGATWGSDVLTNGSVASRLSLRKIVAVRLGFILRTSLAEKEPIFGPADATTHLGTLPLTLTLFSDLPTALQQTRTYAAGTVDLNYRYRTVEVTIPLRNVLIAPQS
jgi:type IV pilus assembly protein PilW